MRPQNHRRISRLRLIVQLTCFAALFYGGYAVSYLSSSEIAPAESFLGPAGVKPVAKRDATLDTYIPSTACIYQRQGLCKGCGLYFLTDSLTWLRSVESLLPYLLILLIMMLLGGRLWCGWVCPMGLISDMLTRLRTGLNLAQARLTRGVREGLVWTKYILLFVFLLVAASAALPSLADARLSMVDPFCQVCPNKIFAAFFSLDEICWTNFHDNITTTFTVLGIVTFTLFFCGLTIRRFWCRICPIGGVYAPFNRTGLVMLVKDSQKCTRCGACQRTCPLDVKRVYQGRERGPVTSFECHLCLRCVESCPESGCLHFKWLGKIVTGS